MADFLESAGGVALITLLLGGGFTSFITHILQASAKERDFQNEMVKLYGEHRLSAQKEFIRERMQTLAASLEIVGKVMKVCQDRVDIDGPRFARRVEPEIEKKNAEQKEEIRKNFNSVAEDWEAKKGGTEPLIGYYFGPAPRRAWREMVLKVDGFLRCADQHKPNPQGDFCKDRERAAAEKAVAELIDILVNTPDHTWLTKDEVQMVREIIAERS